MGLLRDLWLNKLQQDRAQQATDLLLGTEQPLLGPGAPQTGRFGGLIGEKTTPAQFMQAGAQMMGIPGMQQYGMGMMNQAFGNQNISAYQQESLGQDANQFQQRMTQAEQQFDIGQRFREGQEMWQRRWEQMKFNKTNQQRVGPYSDMNQAQGTLNTILDDSRTDLAPYEAAFQNANTVGSIITQRGGIDNMNGADDLALLTAFNKMLRPKEAMMSDDVENARKAAGYLGISESLLDSLKGKGGLGSKTRESIVNTLQLMAKQKQAEYGQLRDYYGIRLSDAGFGQSQMRPAAQFQPFQASQPAPTVDPRIESLFPPEPRLTSRGQR